MFPVSRGTRKIASVHLYLFANNRHDSRPNE